jgi:uncharacterized protein YndB with AHSA1/START domain/GNAT superfamily N-acetyltransferase
MAAGNLSFQPLSSERWSDLETLFGPRGACGGCWCMAWRLAPSEFRRLKGAGTHRAFRALVRKGEPTGILAFDGETPVGWCAVAPREATPRLEGSKVLARVDDLPVWSVTCFFVAKSHRRRGVTVELLRAAAIQARKQGARLLEGYPVEPSTDNLSAAFAWTGLAAAFREAGFTEVARRSKTRPIFRLVLRQSAARRTAGVASPRAAAAAPREIPRKIASVARVGTRDSGPRARSTVATSVIEQARLFSASPEELFRAFADPKLHSAFTGGAATGRLRPGAHFTAWDGYIKGRTLEVEPGRRILQEWSTTEWPEGAAPSRLELIFEAHPRGTRIVLRQVDVPRTQAKAYRTGWDDYYWRPLRAWLAQRARSGSTASPRKRRPPVA